MASNPFDPLTFFAALEDYGNSGETSTADKEFRIATVDPAYNGSGNPKLQFDGETGLTLKTYPFINNPPAPGSRVVLAPVGSGYVILGALGGGSALALGPQGIVGIMRKTTNSPMGTGVPAQSSAVRVMSVTAPVKAGRHYFVELVNLGLYSDSACEMRAVLNHTTNGTDPIASALALSIGQVETPAGGRVKTLDVAVDYKPSTDHTLRVGVSILATAYGGSGSWGAFANSGLPWVTTLRVTDQGPQVADVGASF